LENTNAGDGPKKNGQPQSCPFPHGARITFRAYNTCLKAVGEMYWNIGVPGGKRSICKNVVSKAQFLMGAP
jgi:hypothetical protein